MPVLIDSSRPLASLADAGIPHSHVETTDRSSVSIGGIEIAGSTAEGDRFTFALPSTPGYTVLFGPEVLTSQLKKLFKAELQVGDPAFDDAVFISTDNESRVAKLLEDPALRSAIQNVVLLGGTVSVDGQSIVYHLMGESTDQDLLDMAHFVAAVVG